MQIRLKCNDRTRARVPSVNAHCRFQLFPNIVTCKFVYRRWQIEANEIHDRCVPTSTNSMSKTQKLLYVYAQWVFRHIRRYITLVRYTTLRNLNASMHNTVHKFVNVKRNEYFYLQFCEGLHTRCISPSNQNLIIFFDSLNKKQLEKVSISVNWLIKCAWNYFVNELLYWFWWPSVQNKVLSILSVTVQIW